MAIHVRDNRGGNWFWLHNAIVTRYGAQLGAYGIAVYAVLCCHADREEQATWVGQRAIADEMACSRRQVQRELDKLQALGLLEIAEREDAHGRTSNVYTLLSPPLDSQSRGGDSQAHPPGLTVATPGLPGAAINKTQLTRPMEQGDPGWKASLAETMTAANFLRWVDPLELVERANNHAVLRAPTEQVADYVRRRLADRLAEALGVGRVDVRGT